MIDDLVDRLVAGDVRALARAITLVESGSGQTAEILKRTYPSTGEAYVVGITGSPGSGKSSLVDALAAVYRDRGEKVAIVAVDPSSMYSGGAILGDRIRMQRHTTDPGVFIRSMAHRGHPGGLAKATHDAVDLVDAAGYDIILLETVGVGQDEIEVVEGADTVCVVLVPGMGDDIQSLKAGIMEIAHLFVINKSDRPGADRVEADINQMLSLDTWDDRWRPGLVRTVATRGEGVEALVDQVARHREHISGTDALRQRRHDLSRSRFLDLVRDKLLVAVTDRVGAERMASVIDAIAARRQDPYSAAEQILSAVGFSGDSA